MLRLGDLLRSFPNLLLTITVLESGTACIHTQTVAFSLRMLEVSLERRRGGGGSLAGTVGTPLPLSRCLLLSSN